MDTGARKEIRRKQRKCKQGKEKKKSSFRGRGRGQGRDRGHEHDPEAVPRRSLGEVGLAGAVGAAMNCKGDLTQSRRGAELWQAM